MLKKEKDKQLITRINKNRIKTYNTINYKSLFSLDEFNNEQFNNEDLCIFVEESNIKVYGIKIYRINTNQIYYISQDLCSQLQFDSSVNIIGFDIKTILHKIPFNENIRENIYWDVYLGLRILNENNLHLTIEDAYNYYIKKESEDTLSQLVELYKFQKYILLQDKHRGLFNVFKNIEVPCIYPL